MSPIVAAISNSINKTVKLRCNFPPNEIKQYIYSYDTTAIQQIVDPLNTLYNLLDNENNNTVIINSSVQVLPKTHELCENILYYLRNYHNKILQSNAESL